MSVTGFTPHYLPGSNLRINKVLAMPILFIITRIWGTIARLSCYCFSDWTAFYLCGSPFLQFMENFCDPLQGFINLILYKLTLHAGDPGCRVRCPRMLGPRIMRGMRGQRPVSREPVTAWREQSSSYTQY